MARLTGWLTNAGIFKSEPPKSPWGGSGGKGNGDSTGGGNGGGGGSEDGGPGPRNPWTFPPESKRQRPGGGGSLDELFRRTRRGNGGGHGGFPGGFPEGNRLYWMIAAGLVALWIVFTSFHAIAAQERGVVRFLGSYSYTLDPGVKLTLPAPFNTVEVIDVQNIHKEDFPKDGSENLVLTGDSNIVDMNYSVRWDISNPSDYAFQIKEPDETVRATAESAMRAVLATATLQQTLGAGRSGIEVRVQAMMQNILDEYRSGIRIQGVAIQRADAPNQVADAFKKVTAAQQNAEGMRNSARGYAQQVIATAQGQAAEFDKIYEQYKAAPDVTRRRLYYETMEAVLQKSDKVVVETPGVNPYLPLPGLRQAPAAPAQPATPQGGK